MNQVSDILQRKGSSFISVTPETNVLDALKMMAEKNIGSVIVLQDSNYLGIVTERDYSRKVVLKGKNSANTPVSEIMTNDLPSVGLNDSVDYCLSLMTNNNIRYLPVMVENKLAGILSITDVVQQTILIQQHTINQLDSYINSQ